MVRVERRSFSLLAACLGLIAVAGCAASAASPGGSAAAAPATTSVGQRGGTRVAADGHVDGQPAARRGERRGL